VPYSTTISALDFSGDAAAVRIVAGYTWTEVGGPSGAVERTQENVSLDLTASEYMPGPATFSYAGSLEPPPSPSWFIALWVQEVARIPNGDGWLFRSGRFTTEPPSQPVEIIIAPEQFIGAAELANSVGSLPTTVGSTTVTAVTLTVAGADVALSATGTDTRLPAGVTFTFTATMVLLANGSLGDVDSPFVIRLDNPSIGFTAGPGTGLVTALLNAVAGIIESEVTPKVTATIKGLLNAGVLAQVATSLNRGVPSNLPAGVVVSVRRIRAANRATSGGGTESVIGVRLALGSFGSIVSRFPVVSSGGSTRGCFLATAALGPDAPELTTLRMFRDEWLRARPGGPRVIRLYETLSPGLAVRVERSPRLRAVIRAAVIAPAVRLAGRTLRRTPAARAGAARPPE